MGPPVTTPLVPPRTTRKHFSSKKPLLTVPPPGCYMPPPGLFPSLFLKFFLAPFLLGCNGKFRWSLRVGFSDFLWPFLDQGVLRERNFRLYLIDLSDSLLFSPCKYCGPPESGGRPFLAFSSTVMLSFFPPRSCNRPVSLINPESVPFRLIVPLIESGGNLTCRSLAFVNFFVPGCFPFLSSVSCKGSPKGCPPRPPLQRTYPERLLPHGRACLEIFSQNFFFFK